MTNHAMKRKNERKVSGKQIKACKLMGKVLEETLTTIKAKHKGVVVVFNKYTFKTITCWKCY